jgi:hypothetical protein
MKSVGADDPMKGIEIKSYRNNMMRRRKTEETAASLIGSRESTLVLRA